jgi:hypothetical protein
VERKARKARSEKTAMESWNKFSSVMQIGQRFTGNLLVTKSCHSPPMPWPAPVHRKDSVRGYREKMIDWANHLTSLPDGSVVVLFIIGLDGLTSNYRAFMRLVEVYANLQIVLIIKDHTARWTPSCYNQLWIYNDEANVKYLAVELDDLVRRQPQSMQAKVFAISIKDINEAKYGTRVITANRNVTTLIGKTFECHAPGCNVVKYSKEPLACHKCSHLDFFTWDRLTRETRCYVASCQSTVAVPGNFLFYKHVRKCHPSLFSHIQKTIINPRKTSWKSSRPLAAHIVPPGATFCPLGEACKWNAEHTSQEEHTLHLRIFHPKLWIQAMATQHLNLVDYYSNPDYTTRGPWEQGSSITAEDLREVEELPMGCDDLLLEFNSMGLEEEIQDSEEAESISEVEGKRYASV